MEQDQQSIDAEIILEQSHLIELRAFSGIPLSANILQVVQNHLIGGARP